VDYQLSTKDSIHLNLGFSRSWFQTPNSYDSQNATRGTGLASANNGLGPNGIPVGPADQRSKIDTFNIAHWTRVFNPTTVFNLGGFVRRDGNYYPSNNPFADLGPSNLQQPNYLSIPDTRNTGVLAKCHPCGGHHNIKVGVTYPRPFSPKTTTSESSTKFQRTRA